MGAGDTSWPRLRAKCDDDDNILLLLLLLYLFFVLLQRFGSVRGEDVPFCLGLPLSPLFPYNYTKQDYKISIILVRYLSNFAKSG